MDISWEAPPPAQTGALNKGIKRSKYWDVLDELEKNPGEWACVDKRSASPSSPIYALIRNNSLPFEVATRKNVDGTFAIYARRTIETQE